jgi:hypothetical protein
VKTRRARTSAIRSTPHKAGVKRDAGACCEVWMTVATNGAAAFMCTFSPSLLNFLNEQLDSLPLKFQMTLIVTDTMLLAGNMWR